MRMFLRLAALTVITTTLSAGAWAAELNEQSFARWRDYIRPSAEERRWLEIPWRPSLWEAVAEGRKADRPILFWGMSGHPLACT